MTDNHDLGTSKDDQAIALNLDDLQWERRLIFVLGFHSGESLLEEQCEALRNEKEAMLEREVLLFCILGERGTVEGELPKGLSKAGAKPGEMERRPLQTSFIAALKKRFGADEKHFCAILVGKDGTEKMRRNAFVEPDVFFERIDQMPMRQREMKEE